MELVRFLGWEDTYALFEIKKGKRIDNRSIDRILVLYQGNWIEDNAMICHPKYDKFEDVQDDLGKGLIFQAKNYDDIRNRSSFEYEIKEKEAILAVPATGEELDFEIYGTNQNNMPVLLLKREL